MLKKTHLKSTYCKNQKQEFPQQKKSRRLLLFTSGGDAPGMNAAIRAVVRSGIYHGLEIFACHNGFQGVIDQDIFPMHEASVANCIQYGGTILKSGRAPDFTNPKVRATCRAFLAAQSIDYLVAIGGDGTFRGATLLEEEGGPKAIGIPATIDNDIIGTDYSIGYDTARNTAMQAIDKIRDTASSSNKYFLVETMGRCAGFLAVDVGLAGGVEYILAPEFPISTPELAKIISAPTRLKKSLLIVVAEAGQPGRSIEIMQELRKLAPQFSYRVCVLGHTQRGGMPTAMDRIAGSHMGNLAIEGLLNGKSKCMVGFKNGEYKLVPFPSPNQPSRRLENDKLIKLTMVLAT